MQDEQPAAHAPSTEMMTVKADMTFGDGFRFGCGFMSAFIIFWIVITILGMILAGLAFVVAPGLSNLLPHLAVGG